MNKLVSIKGVNKQKHTVKVTYLHGRKEEELSRVWDLSFDVDFFNLREMILASDNPDKFIEKILPYLPNNGEPEHLRSHHLVMKFDEVASKLSTSEKAAWKDAFTTEEWSHESFDGHYESGFVHFTNTAAFLVSR